MRPCGDLGRVAVDIGVVAEHVDRDRAGVLGDGRFVVLGHGVIVGCRDRHGHRRGVGLAVAVGDRVAERVSTVRVGVRVVGQAGSATGDRDGALRPVRRGDDLELVAVDVGVADEDEDRRGGGILGHGDGVVVGDRLVVDLVDGDGDRGGRELTARLHRVVEGIGAGEIGIGSVGQGLAVAGDHDLAVGGVRRRHDAPGVGIGVVVVGEDVDGRRGRVLIDGHGVVHGDGRRGADPDGEGKTHEDDGEGDDGAAGTDHCGTLAVTDSDASSDPSMTVSVIV